TKCFQQKSFAQAVRNTQLLNNNPTSKHANPVAHINSQDQNTSLNTILQVIYKLGEEIKTIKSTLTDMDNRLSHIEEDTYWVHATHKEDEVDFIEYEMNCNTTPEPQMSIPEETFSSYHRKRPATSPIQDIREEQQQLHSRIAAMGDTLQQISTSFGLLAEESIPQLQVQSEEVLDNSNQTSQ